jgi:hypothetical protein
VYHLPHPHNPEHLSTGYLQNANTASKLPAKNAKKCKKCKNFFHPTRFRTLVIPIGAKWFIWVTVNGWEVKLGASFEGLVFDSVYYEKQPFILSAH